MNLLIIFSFIAISLSSLATPTEYRTINGPIYGGKFNILINKPLNVIAGERLIYVVIAPGIKDGPSSQLYELIAQKLSDKGYLVVRFNWQDLENLDSSKDDSYVYSQVLISMALLPPFLAEDFGLPREIIFISKSFGSRVFANWVKSEFGYPQFFHINDNIKNRTVLLTPNCNEQMKFDEKYKDVVRVYDRKLLIVMSVDDPYCEIKQITESKLIQFPDLHYFNLITAKGDHKFSLQNPTLDSENLKSITKDVVDWILRH